MAGDASPRPDDQLLELVYEQLRALAEQRMAGERKAHTLHATALVHEAFPRVAPRLGADLDSRTRFVQAAAASMRRILIDHARSRGRIKRGEGRSALPLDIVDLATAPDPAEILALDEALRRLRARDERAAEAFPGRRSPWLASCSAHPRTASARRCCRSLSESDRATACCSFPPTSASSVCCSTVAATHSCR